MAALRAQLTQMETERATERAAAEAKEKERADKTARHLGTAHSKRVLSIET